MKRAISLQHFLARPVVRMGLAGEDELHRQLRVVDKRGDLLEVLEDQVGPLVGGEAAGEADRQRVEARAPGRSRWTTSRGFAAPLGLPRGAAADEADQLGLEHLVRLPQLAVVDSADLVPQRRVAAAADQSGPRCRSNNWRICGASQDGHVHAVGDVADRDFVLGAAGIQALPHRRGSRGRAATRRRWRGASSSAPAPSCRILRPGCAG